GHVASDGFDVLDPLSVQRFGGGAALRLVAAADDDGDAKLSEPPGRLQADPLVRPGDERDFVLRCHGLAPLVNGSCYGSGWPDRSGRPLTGRFYLHIQIIWKTSTSRSPRNADCPSRHASVRPCGRPP